MQEEQRAAFTALVARHEAELARYLRRMVGDRELARDLLQETLLAAFRAWPPRSAVNLRGWLFRIATNEALAHFHRRKLKAWIPFSRLPPVGREPSSRGHSDQVDTQVAVAATLEQLAPRDRACLLLDASGFSGEEIAAQLGCSPAAARTRLFRAREAFRQHYRQQSADASEEDQCHAMS